MPARMATGAVAVLLAAAAAPAQVYYQPAPPPAPVVYPAQYGTPYPVPYAAPAPPAGGGYGRVGSAFIDPAAAFSGRPVQSNAPLLDAAPNAARVGFIVAAIAGAGTGGAALAIPPAIRAVRVLVAGPPAVAQNRRDTLLWIASPTILTVRNRVQARRAGGGGVLFSGRRCGCR